MFHIQYQLSCRHNNVVTNMCVGCITYPVIIATQNNTTNVFANVVDITLYGSHNYGTVTLDLSGSSEKHIFFFFNLDEFDQMGNSLLHDTKNKQMGVVSVLCVRAKYIKMVCLLLKWDLTVRNE